MQTATMRTSWMRNSRRASGPPRDRNRRRARRGGAAWPGSSPAGATGTAGPPIPASRSLLGTAGEHQCQADRGQPRVLGHGGAVLGGADAVVLGHRVDGEVVRHESGGERRQCGTGEASGHEGQQQGGSDSDLTIGEELPELGRSEVLDHGHTIGGHLLEAGGGLLVHAEFADARVEDECAGNCAQKCCTELHDLLLLWVATAPKTNREASGCATAGPHPAPPEVTQPSPVVTVPATGFTASAGLR